MKRSLLFTTAIALTFAMTSLATAHDGPPKGPHGPMEQAIDQLPPKDAEQFRATLKQAHEADKPVMEKIRHIDEELRTLTKAETFDKEAYLAKAKEKDELERTHHTHMTAAHAEALSKLPAPARKTLADAMPPHHGEHPHPAPGEGPAEKPAPAGIEK